MAQQELDVTKLEPKLKHPTIFDRFALLAPGETLLIHNDHDPKPLYYQMLGELGNVFHWQYLEEGPDWWRVNITRRALAEGESTLGEIAAKDLRKAQVFARNGIDFCCGGKKTLQEACAEKGLDMMRIEKELEQAAQLPAQRALPYHEWSLDLLADYIVQTHHSFMRQSLPQLVSLSQKVAEVHGAHHPELVEVAALVTATDSELAGHLIKEERVLFPYVKALVKANKSDATAQASVFDSVQQPVNMMEMEHEVVGGYLAKIRSLTNNYTLPADACNSYKLLFEQLEAFEADTHLHVHLENNILFPKAVQLEQSLSAA